MTTHRIPILGFGTKPDASGNVFVEPFTVKAVNDQWGRLVMVFNDTATRIGCQGGFAVPLNYVGNASLIVVWTSSAIAGDVEWDFDYRAVSGDDTESLDQAGTQESVNQNDTAPTAAFRRLEAALALTDGNFAPGDEVEFGLFRDGTDGGDTMAAAALVFEVLFQYDDA